MNIIQVGAISGELAISNMRFNKSFLFRRDEYYDMSSDEELRIKAKEKAEKKLGFYTHLGIYVVVNLFLVGVWWFTDGFGTFPWFVFPLFGWGIAIAANFISVFKETNYLEKMTEKEYERLKKQEK